MNRRELFKGVAAALAAASIPIPFTEDDLFGRSPAMDALPDMRMLQYFRRVQQEIFDKLINPPVVMAEDGTLTILDQPSLRDAMQFVDTAIYNLEHGESAIARING